MGMSAVNAGRNAWKAQSDARLRAAEEDLLGRLTDAAMDVLHHDRTEGSDVDKHERRALRKKFARILKIKLVQ